MHVLHACMMHAMSVDTARIMKGHEGVSLTHKMNIK